MITSWETLAVFIVTTLFLAGGLLGGRMLLVQIKELVREIRRREKDMVAIFDSPNDVAIMVIAGIVNELQLGNVTAEKLSKEIPAKIKLVGTLLELGADKADELTQAVENIISGNNG
jgi:hypothetical protein